MKRVLLGLGSNQTFNNLSPIEVLHSACDELSLILESPVFSSIYQTKAMYVTKQDDFYNMAALGFVNDDEDPYEFLEKIHKIENKYGRDREKEIRFGPRPLDIDIELFGDFVSDDPVLTIPHSRIKERAFVLVPALEILRKSADNQLAEEFEKYLRTVDYDGSFRKHDYNRS